MIKKIISLLFIVLCINVYLYSQFTLSGELRPRTEYSHGHGELAGPNQEASTFTSQRTRINFLYKTDLFTTKLSLQDVRFWGNQPQLVENEDKSTSIHEAWAELKLFEDASLKVGRQEVVYDDHRIFGNVGWAQQARSHDMAIFKYEGVIKAHLGAAYYENSDRKNNIYEGPDAYKALQFIWLGKKLGNLNLSLLFLNNGTPFTEATDTSGNITEQSTKYSQTIGPRVVYKINGFTFSGNYYYQGGKDKVNNNLNAYEVALEAKYKLSSGLLFTLGWERLSGTDFNETSPNNSFTPFYGTNHKFNGLMDYFYVGNHTNNVGLCNLYLKAKYTKNKFFVDAHVHSFRSAAKIAANTDDFLGIEFDLWAGYTVSKAVNAKAGYSQMFASESMELLKGGSGSKDEVNNWAWIMLTFKPTFFKSQE